MATGLPFGMFLAAVILMSPDWGIYWNLDNITNLERGIAVV